MRGETVPIGCVYAMCETAMRCAPLGACRLPVPNQASTHLPNRKSGVGVPPLGLLLRRWKCESNRLEFGRGSIGWLRRQPVFGEACIITYNIHHHHPSFDRLTNAASRGLANIYCGALCSCSSRCRTAEAACSFAALWPQENKQGPKKSQYSFAAHEQTPIPHAQAVPSVPCRQAPTAPPPPHPRADRSPQEKKTKRVIAAGHLRCRKA